MKLTLIVLLSSLILPPSLVLASSVADENETEDIVIAKYRVTFSKEKLESMCEKNDGIACAASGFEFYSEKSPKESIDFFKKACDLEQGLSCDMLASAYDAGIGVRQSYKKATELFQRSCNLGYSPACTSLGKHYNQGKGVEKSDIKANELFQKGCDMGDGEGCTGLALNYALGNGGPKSLAKAMEVSEKACSLKSKIGCFLAGSIYEKEKQNLSTAKEYYGKACDLGYQDGCKDYARLNTQGR